MSNTSVHILLLRDAAARTIASPGASHCWHRLADAYRRVEDEVVKGAVVQDLLAHTPADGVAGFLRATWLASMTNDDARLADAGRIVQGIAPFDPDRLIAFLAYAWNWVLKHATDRVAFAQAVRQACVPDILHRLGQHLSRHAETRPPARKIENVRKIALITPILSAYPHAPTAAALHQTRILIEQGVQVGLFSCLDHKAPGMKHFLGGGEDISMEPFDASQWRAHLRPGLVIRQGVDRFSVMGRWTQMLKDISAFDPDLVMSVGFYAPMVAPLYEARPVLGLNIHSVAPLDPVDVWLCAFKDEAGKTRAQWGGHLPDSVAWYHPYRVPRTPPGPPGSASRRELGLPEAALVLISVGYRLETEIDGAWASRMIALLGEQPNVTWLLVGATGAMPAALAHAPAAQVRVLRARGDIPAVLQCCDIYVNPPRMGGGYSVAEAMAEGLPVVAYGGSDGGHKVGGSAVGDDAAYFARLAALIASADLRRQEGQAMRALFSSTLDLDQSAPSLLAACDLALERFRRRATPVTS